MKKTIILLLCAALAASSLSGCKNETAYTPTGDALVIDDAPIPVAPGDRQPQEQDLTLIYYPDKSLNPLQCTDFTNRVLFSLLYQGLFAVDRDYNPTPILCRQYAVSEDMKTYTFYLEDATFSDGSPVTPADVVATMEAAKSSAFYGGRFAHISDFSAGDDGTVVFHTDTPMENLPVLLDIPILKAGEVGASTPLGTGPYYPDNASGKLLLRRRSDWWCSAAMTVTAPAISLSVAQSNPQIRDEFEFSGLDLVCANPGSDRYADYRCDYELWDCENGVFLYLSCNMESEIFSNEAVRAALTYAIDRDTIASSNYRGFARSASLPASPVSPYYSAIQAAKYAYDGGASFRQAVADAGLVGKKLILLVNSDDTMRTRIARSIQQTMIDAGFDVELHDYRSSDYRASLQRGEYDLLLGQTRLSPNMDLSAFFSSGGALNYGKLDDVAIYTLCSEALANRGNYYTLHQAVMDDGRLCPILFSSYAIYATRGLLTGLTPSRDNVFYYTLGKTMSAAKIQ